MSFELLVANCIGTPSLMHLSHTPIIHHARKRIQARHRPSSTISDHLCSELDLPQISLWRQSTLRDSHLGDVRVLEFVVSNVSVCCLPKFSYHTSKLYRLTTSQLIHGSLGNVEAAGSSVDGENVDRLALIRDGVTLSALSAIPAWNCVRTADVGEVWDGAEGFVAVSKTSC